MRLDETVDFSINVVGDKTGQNWLGNFSARRRLSHKLDLQKDRIYRELLGPDAEHASTRAQSQAEIFSDLKVCLVKAPEWFREADFGLDLQDDNIIRSIWEETVRIRVEAIKEVEDKAKKATEGLKELVKDTK